jgi:hypothetical protein
LIDSQADQDVDTVAPVVSAISMCKVLLDTLQHSLRDNTTIAQCHPHVVYLIYTMAIGFLYFLRQIKNPPMASFSISLTAQVALLSCSEALDKMAETWPLAKKYCRAVESLMEAEQLDALHSRPKRENNLSGTGQLSVTTTGRPQEKSHTDQFNLDHLLPNDRYDNQKVQPWSLSASIMPEALPPLQDDNLFPTIDEMIGTTGWGLPFPGDYSDFSFAELQFGYPNAGTNNVTDTEALLEGLATSNSAQPFLVQSGRGADVPVRPPDRIVHEARHRTGDPGITTGGQTSVFMGSGPGHALDLLAHHALDGHHS